jgi:hypothetical protein
MVERGGRTSSTSVSKRSEGSMLSTSSWILRLEMMRLALVASWPRDASWEPLACPSASLIPLIGGRCISEPAKVDDVTWPPVTVGRGGGNGTGAGVIG